MELNFCLIWPRKIYFLVLFSYFFNRIKGNGGLLKDYNVANSHDLFVPLKIFGVCYSWSHGTINM